MLIMDEMKLSKYVYLMEKYKINPEKLTLSALSRIFVPKIIGDEEIYLVKKLIILQLFTRPDLKEKFHILIVGEVGSGKTEIGLEVKDLAFPCEFTSKKTTPVGMLEALMAADGGFIVCDELDKLDKEVREQMLEAMQSQTITYRKYEFHVQKKARVNVLAFCNPANYWFSTDVLLDVPFEPPLLSRFHVITRIKKVNPERYEEIAKNYDITQEESEERKEFLRKIISHYKRNYPNPVIPEPVKKRIGWFAKQAAMSSRLRNIITPRIIEGLFSACKAMARIHGKEIVDKDVWVETYRLMSKFYF